MKFQELKLIEKDEKLKKLEENTNIFAKKIVRLEEAVKVKNKESLNIYSKFDKLLETLETTNKKYEMIKNEHKKFKSYYDNHNALSETFEGKLDFF
eukprot:CAMPEP_0116934116 /NCGR_PEP_ID=MMETSP0467-20121206/29447_1 /TAXON_ID=283647 /ORGANISM="Mesodinium pulex, Strain SPMC105" /LENGTH=95 /DNA_ID=CAMNT_0004615139 /DNA_START=379 /DNA_END=666 /DNA_ORIENTATION=+